MSPVLPREERDAIRARAEAATDGPWTAHNMERAGWLIETPESREAGEYPAAEVREGRDAEFIAHARTDVPALLDALDAAEAEIDRLRAECDRAWDVAVEERLRRLEAQAGIESPPEPEPDPLAGRLPAQVEYGLVWDDLGSADTFPTLEQARAAARGFDEPAQVVRIETWPVADEGAER